jgi:Cys-rich four helix bundle protein (predicted Tat secretion target)
MLTRRDLMIAGGSAVLAHAVVASAADAPAAPTDKGQALTSATAECVRTGEACMQHCLDELATGDKMLGDCAQSVNQMLAICRAVGPVVDAKGKYVKAMVQLCHDVCTDCEQVCRKHAQHHAICAACADACAVVVKASQALIA